MPLQAGTWSANVGGIAAQIQISSVDSLGNVSGNIAGTMPFSDFWEEASQRITFTFTRSFNSVQVFVGYLFVDSINLVGVTGSVIFTLTGYVETFLKIPTNNTSPPDSIGPPPLAKCSVFGWYAQLGVD